MCIQSQMTILRQHTNRVYSWIDTVAQRKINNTILSAKGYCRFSHVCRLNPQSTALSPRKEHSDHFFLNHVITSCCSLWFSYYTTIRLNCEHFLLFFLYLTPKDVQYSDFFRLRRKIKHYFFTIISIDFCAFLYIDLKIFIFFLIQAIIG